ncbi:hypothetical protein EUX98_g4522 [Antrodiella citrinella]|uniref:F-box domain-containing protein n=1 Tax=Antrodiella citrinella TaxID=2447956 RepID=A0A4S4MTT3_9APHY|nr:hypothetical protein EUX98_g4522 [Antrodiella citrinella]
MLSTIPDDCILDILSVTGILDVVRLRRTCRELNRISRSRIVWLTIYARLSRTLVMPPLPVPHTLMTIPAIQLETICISAYNLHNNWTSRLPSPTRVSSVISHFEQYSGFCKDTAEPIKSAHLAPGGRWLILLMVDLSISVCDLVTTVAHSAVVRTQVIACHKEQLAKEGLRDMYAPHGVQARVTWLDGMTARVFLQSVATADNRRAFAYQEWTIRILGGGDALSTAAKAQASLSSEPRGEDKPFLECTLRAFKSMSHLVSPWLVDVSAAPTLSYFENNAGEVHVYDAERGTSVILQGKEPEQSLARNPRFAFLSIETRVLKTDERTYVGCIDEQMNVHVYLVPLVEESQAATHHVQGTPVAKDNLGPYQPGETRIGAWHRLSSEEGTFFLQILAPDALYTLTFSPSTHVLRKTKLEFPVSSIPHLPSSSGQRRWGRLGTERGSRGVLVSEDDRGRQILKLISGSSTDSESSPTDFAEHLSSAAGLRTVLGGLGGASKFVGTFTHGAALAFDEYTGRMCFLKLKDRSGGLGIMQVEFLVVDFAQKELLNMY